PQVTYTGGALEFGSSFSRPVGDASGLNPGYFGPNFEISVACLLAGTHVLTATGEVPVEALRPGDLVLTHGPDGRVARPVKWIGYRRIDIARHKQPMLVAPIRIRAGAVADAVPHRDLLVSPDHAIYIDGVLVCARVLVNGATILRDEGFPEAAYYHVE